MRCLNAWLVIGSLAMIGALPAMSQSVAIGSSPALQSAASGNSAFEKESYTRKAQDDVLEWQQKLHKFGVKADATGRQDIIAANHDLNEAWTKTKIEAHKLQTAGADDWDGAKASYEKASRDLAGEWDKIRPEDR